MRVALRERALATALIVPIAIVVIVLAVLQYRSSDQVRTATTMRLADSLQMSMMNWHLNLFRDLSDICAKLQIDSATVGTPELDDQARRFQTWRSSAPFPDLVSQLYVVPSGESTLPVLRLDPSMHYFESTPRPPRLDGLWRDLQHASDAAYPAGSPPVDSGFAGRESEGWHFDPNLPALVRPFVAATTLFAEPARARLKTRAWLVVELSTDVARARFLPALANRYFSGVDGLDYQVALVAGTRPRRVLYSSDPGFGDQDSPDADGRMDLFGRPLDKISGSSIYVFYKPSQETGLTASLGTSWFPLLGSIPAEEDWQLVVRHRRGGPLGAFVADVRRRDLAISFGVLLMLVVSITMWIVASHRALRLARLQMGFVTAVSHELQTPLTIISSAAENITQGLVREPQQLAQYGTVIGNQAHRLSEIVEQVLLFGSTQAAHQRYLLRPLDISKVIDQTLTVSAALIQASHVTVECHIDPSLPPVMGDPLALSRCLQNLITNGLKYGGEQRWLGIRAGLVQNGNGSEIQVSVSDRGNGIAASDLRHIFEPFYRSPSVEAAHIHGTGLGLTVARGIAEAMNGRLTVTTAPGRGSTFTVYLQRAEETAVRIDATARQVVTEAPS